MLSTLLQLLKSKKVLVTLTAAVAYLLGKLGFDIEDVYLEQLILNLGALVAAFALEDIGKGDVLQPSFGAVLKDLLTRKKTWVTLAAVAVWFAGLFGLPLPPEMIENIMLGIAGLTGAIGVADLGKAKLQPPAEPVVEPTPSADEVE